MKQIDDISKFQLREIKNSHITAEELSIVHHITKLSYEELFNKRARKYKDIKQALISGQDDQYRALILSEYTFLKRPIIVCDGKAFVGNAKKTIAAMLNAVSE